MAARRYTFQFGRVSIVGRIVENKKNFYNDVFLAKKTVADRFNKFRFFEIHPLYENQEYFIVGQLVKYKAKEEDIVIEDSDAFGTSIVDNAIIAKPDFVLHPHTGIIAFRSMPSLFSPNQFRSKFARLIEAAFDNYFISVIVETINEKFEIQEQFHKLRKIKSICLDLHPSNPNNDDLWRGLDERLKEYGASKFTQEINAADDGSLNKTAIEKSDVYAGILMASDGYGFASIEGEQEDGRKVKVTTNDNPTEAKSTLDGDPEHLINNLHKTFQSVWKRTKNESKN